MSFSKSISVNIKTTVNPKIIVNGYYVQGNVTVHIECTTSGGGHITSIRIVDASNNDLTLDGNYGGSASVTGSTITLTGFTQSFYWTDHTIGFTHYDGNFNT
jgi:hypothetical protein